MLPKAHLGRFFAISFLDGGVRWGVNRNGGYVAHWMVLHRFSVGINAVLICLIRNVSTTRGIMCQSSLFLGPNASTLSFRAWLFVGRALPGGDIYWAKLN
jgi:hypothetical protein